MSATDNAPLCSAEIHDLLHPAGILTNVSGDTGMCTAGLPSIIFAHSCSARQTSGEIFMEWECETVISQLVEGDVVCPDWVISFRPAVCFVCNSASHYRILHSLHYKNH